MAITYGKVNSFNKILKDELVYYEKQKTNAKAITYIKVIKSNNDYSLVELNPITGRKHQRGNNF